MIISATIKYSLLIFLLIVLLLMIYIDLIKLKRNKKFFIMDDSLKYIDIINNKKTIDIKYEKNNVNNYYLT